MILEYHKIDYPEERWTRTPENFRRDLETLYAKGYRLINLGRPARPAHHAAGRHDARSCSRSTTPRPVSSATSSRTAPSRSIPSRAWASSRRSSREKPGLRSGGDVLRAAGRQQAQPPLQSAGARGRKLQYLVSQGYEIGNHTLWHANLGKYDEATVRAQIAEAQVWIQRHVPDYKTAHPGAAARRRIPKDVGWALQGTAKGTTLQPRRHPDGGRRRRAFAVFARVRSRAPAAHPGRRSATSPTGSPTSTRTPASASSATATRPRSRSRGAPRPPPHEYRTLRVVER